MDPFKLTATVDPATVEPYGDGHVAEFDLSTAEQSEVLSFVEQNYLPHEVFSDETLRNYCIERGWAYSYVGRTA